MGGRSCAATRLSKHRNNKRLLGNTIRKYGVEWFIIAHDEEFHIPEVEMDFISKNGLDTMFPSGLNFQEGDVEGKQGKKSEAEVEWMKTYRNEPAYNQNMKLKLSINHANKSVAEQQIRYDKQKETKSAPEWKEDFSGKMKEALDARSDEKKKLHRERLAAAHLRRRRESIANATPKERAKILKRCALRGLSV